MLNLLLFAFNSLIIYKLWYFMQESEQYDIFILNACPLKSKNVKNITMF